MQGVLTTLADKEQPLLGTIGFAGEAAARACLTGVVRIDLHAQRARQHCLVVQEASQLDKGPLARMLIGAVLLLARLLAVLALGAVTNAGQVFQADKRPGMGVHNPLTDGVIGIQLQPSLSLCQRDFAPCGAASAFSLKPL